MLPAKRAGIDNCCGRGWKVLIICKLNIYMPYMFWLTSISIIMSLLVRLFHTMYNGFPVVEFNCHRIAAIEQLIDMHILFCNYVLDH